MNTTSNLRLDQLTEMSRRYGGDPDYVLAGGGNSSVKEDGVLCVKGSGTALGTIEPEQFVRMDLEAVRATLRKRYPAEDDAREAAALADLMAARLPGEQGRPSVECLLHALFPQRYMLHTHPALVNGLTCAKDGAARLRELFGDEVVWIELTKPGYILATVCERAFARHTEKTGAPPRIVMLQNHGLCVAGETVEEIDAAMSHVVEVLSGAVADRPDFSDADFDAALASSTAPVLRMLRAQDGRASAVFCTNREIQALCGEQLDALREPFTPDHIVYSKDSPLILPPDGDLSAAWADYLARKGYPPRIVLVEGLGFFAVGASRKEALTARDLFLDAVKIAVYSRSFGGTLTLPRSFTDFILNWEVEQYRSKVSGSAGGGRRLEGKIALVTGSAQGFGRGIAEALAEQGACVAIADLNLEGAERCALEFRDRFGVHSAVAIHANVADEDSVKAMIEETVLAFGGLDVLVSNAGVLTAGGLDEMTKQQFDLVTAVNYTGYFLCAKYASAVMKLQNRHAPGYMTDIIEINSKSGLAGSNKNFAYAGSKFGGVGLTQSFALELVEHGIKVNAVCPGNLLDGPLWSDPERGLFRQYLDAGKVEGAKTIADVRAFYENKVPMKRGCTVEDVALAILYVIEQQYETGQAVPVTGGQVMLR